MSVEAASIFGDDVGGLVLTEAITPRQSPTDDWPSGGAGVPEVLGSLARDRATTLRGVANATLALPVGPDVVESMWRQLMESGLRFDDTGRGLVDIDQRLISTLTCPVMPMYGQRDVFVGFDAVEASRPL